MRPLASPGSLDYQRQDEASLPATLASIPAVRERLGGLPAQWTAREVGDGNLNLVFVVRGTRGAVIAKQALPFVRMVGESWPLPLSRSHYEYAALSEHMRLTPGLVPQLLHRDDALALNVMELLEPHVIMRRGLIAGTRYPRFADALSTFLARTLFFTSDLALPAAEKKSRLAEFTGNTAMCKITEDLIFTEPYFAAPHNRWTTPQLDRTVAALRIDMPLKIAAARLKWAFLSRAEALLHGDLHTGAVMLTEADTRVIDAEFAFYGPMGFDVGVLIANLLLSAFSQPGHEREPGERDDYCRWILHTTEAVWNGFHAKFLALWRGGSPGDVFAAPAFEDATEHSLMDAEREASLGRVFVDALGFAGLEMIRRSVGLSHVIDFDQIADPARRAPCEARAIEMGRRLVLDAGKFTSIAAVTALARDTAGHSGDRHDRHH